MDRFKYDQFDKLSFWIGFITGVLLWWLLSQFRVSARQIKTLIQRIIDRIRRSTQSSVERNYRIDLLRETQRKHLAASMFSLDEIGIPPQLYPPPIRIEPGGPIPLENITDQIIPYTPDWLEIASATKASTLSLTQALQGNSNLIIFGRSGIGKTTALCHLASEIVRNARSDYVDKIPILIHVGNLILNIKGARQPLEPIINAASLYCSSKTHSRLHNFLCSCFEHNRALILLDGMDEMTTEVIDEVIGYIEQLIEIYPGNQFVVATSDEYYGKLPRLGFIPLGLVPWNQDQKRNFLSKWDACWKEYILPLLTKESNQDTTIIQEWLLSERLPSSPLEFTLKTWSLYTQYPSAPGFDQTIEDYILRMTADQPEDAKALEKLALQIYIKQTPLINFKEIDHWELRLEDIFSPFTYGSESSQKNAFETSNQNIAHAKISRSISRLLEKGLVWMTANEQVGIVHPTVTACLAAKALCRFGLFLQFPEQMKYLNLDYWAIGTATLEFILTYSGKQSFVNQVLGQNTQPLNRALIALARSLSIRRVNSKWRDSILKNLALIVQQDDLPLELKVKTLTSLIFSGNSGVNILLRDLLNSNRPNLRFLGTLGISLYSDPTYIDKISMLLNDPMPSIQCAACLALSSIGNKKCTDILTEALLHGNEELQRAAAEALARLGENGPEILREAVNSSDLLVRRAAIFGLHRLRTKWALELLEKMGFEDSQWVVKDAAMQALEALKHTDFRIPRPYPEPSETVWLIAYAGSKGEGIPAGNKSLDIFLSVLQDGNNDQKIAALDYLKFQGDASVIPIVKEIYFSSQGELKSFAYDALWHLSLSGYKV